MTRFKWQSAAVLAGVFGAERTVYALVLVMVMTVVAGCRQGADMRDTRTAAKAPNDKPPRGEPVKIPVSLTATRSTYQSRSIIMLDVKSNKIHDNDEFSLVNDTTGAVLIEREHPKLALAEYDDSGWYLDTDSVTLKIYQINPKFAGSFAPGVNNLRLYISNTEDDVARVAKTQVTLRDFLVFSEASGIFESGEQRSGGFEGSFVPFANSVVTSKSKGKGILVTGFVNIVNK
jgi:hypothetical protein